MSVLLHKLTLPNWSLWQPDYPICAVQLMDALQILGTFITEWEAGSILCELLLWTEQSAEAAALQLANIAVFYGFDGWLLNIENPILHRHVPNLVHFIRYSEVTPPSWPFIP